jgi:ComF family protein
VVLSSLLRRIVCGLRHGGRELAAVCYPSACSACGAFIEAGGLLCPECEDQLAGVVGPACGRCAAPLAQEGDPCPWCIGRGIRPFARVARLAVFEEPMRGLIHQFKYRGRWPLAELLGDRLAEAPAVRAILADAQVLVPVPLHFLRHWWRGYNQAEVLAGRLARHSRSARVVRAVSRIRFTPAQTQQTSASARRANVKGAFALMSPGEVAGRHVVVVDDVIGRMLLHARPASLCAISLALADARGRQFKRI